MTNIVKEYIDFSKKTICIYIKNIIGNYYNDKFCKQLVSKYLEYRLYNYDSNNPEETKLNLNRCMDNYIDNIKENNKVKNIDVIYVGAKYAIYFYYSENIDNMLNNSKTFQIKKLNIDDSNYINTMKKLIKENHTRLNKFFDKFESKHFNIDYNKILNQSIYNTCLNYEIEFPSLYSNDAINAAFNKGLVKEDKMLIYYSMVAIKILKDIIIRKYDNEYLVDFDCSLFKKSNKLVRTLNIIDNDVSKDHLLFKVSFSDYNDNKDNIIELMQDGYKFAIIIDGKYKSSDNIDMFTYIIIPKEIDINLENDKIIRL